MKNLPVMTILMLTIFVVMVGISSTYPEGARFMTFVVGIPAIAICLLQLALDLYRRRAVESEDSRSALRPSSASAPSAARRR